VRARAALLAALTGFAVLLAAPMAGASTRAPLPPPSLFDLAAPSGPPRDLVLPRPNAAAARAMAQASATRYPVNDGHGRSVAIAVSAACQLACSAANPQQIADFLGTLVHGDEMNLLTVDLQTPFELGFTCGVDASACYYPGQNRMLISGDETPAPDGATREFVIAHEYGHHVASHLQNPPFEPAIDWGGKRWDTYERVCQGVHQGVYFPGDESTGPGSHYYENPGEAWAEASAFNRFRNAPVAWAWTPSLKPDAGAFAAITADTTNPWRHRTRLVLRGRLRRGQKQVTKLLRTPLDGSLSLALRGQPGAELDLQLRDHSGALLRRSAGVGPNEALSFTVCGQSRLRAVVKRGGRGSGRFRLVVRRP
jgi:hypothetical protein